MNWQDSPNKVWLDIDAGIYAVVSDDDFQWAIQWRWQITWDRHKRKAYATRSTTDGGAGRNVKLYLHKEVLKRKGDQQPSARHTMGDHGDGHSLNCYRENLSWATASMNRRTARKPFVMPKTQEELPF